MSSPRALVAGHSTFADGMIAAVTQIAGRGDVFVGFSSRNLSAAGVQSGMRERIDADGIQVIFTDLPAGSCTMAARRLLREVPGLTVVTGVNLGTLLDFAFNEDVPAGEAAAAAADKGRMSLSVVGGGTARGA